ncbi:MAG: DNA-directed RNA polymerase subunit alpha C-terminal domain-containing protein [Polyangiales bacterium]
MPVFEDDAEPQLAQVAPTFASIAESAALSRVIDRSESASISVLVERDASVRGIVANRAAASALLVRHKWVYEQDRLRAATDVAREWTPEQKLLRAIFGERADTVAVKGLDDRGVPEEGATILRGDPVLCDPMSRAEFRFIEESEATIARVEIVTTGLPEALRERAIVTVVRDQPLCVGDSILCDGHTVGTVTAITDDGRAEPALRIGSEVSLSTPSATVSRLTTTARQQLVARAVGAYEPRTERPIGVDSVAFDALVSLVDRGCLALFTDFAAHKFDSRSMRSALQESMMQGKVIEQPFTREGTVPPPASDAGIFDFFSRPKTNSPSGSALLRATAYARALGVDLRYEPSHALSLSPRASASIESAGEVTSDLGDPRLFGPRRSYECECGALKLMKHRGRVCEKCGVTVLDSSARATTFAHVALRDLWTHPLSGAAVSEVAVLPPTLREANDSELEAAYQSLVSARSADAAQRVFDLLLDRLCDALRAPDAAVFDYSCAAICVVDEGVAPDALLVPLDAVATMCAPLLCGKLEELGYAATIMSARSTLRSDDALRRATSEWALRTRPLLVHAERSPFVAIDALGVIDEPVFRVGTRLAKRLGLTTGSRLSAHVPLSNAAIREASWLVANTDGTALRARPHPESQWIVSLASAARDQRSSLLRDAVLARSVDRCSSPSAAWILGGYIVEDEAGLVDRGAARFDPPTYGDENASDSSGESSMLDLRVDELEVSVRAANAMQLMGITTVRELVQKTEAELLKSKNFGVKTLSELKFILAEMGLSFGMRL